ncbi:MAG: Ig-like domain-containing protein, partial [Firmicutes bacterium]|nr:Ig-like domain-containing protein [Bacillota bacterium]
MTVLRNKKRLAGAIVALVVVTLVFSVIALQQRDSANACVGVVCFEKIENTYASVQPLNQHHTHNFRYIQIRLLNNNRLFDYFAGGGSGFSMQIMYGGSLAPRVSNINSEYLMLFLDIRHVPLAQLAPRNSGLPLTTNWQANFIEFDNYNICSACCVGSHVNNFMRLVENAPINDLPIVVLPPLPISIEIVALGDTRIRMGETLQLGINVYPLNATRDIEWSSSNTSVATINQSGLLTAVGVGSVTITARVLDIRAA